MKTRKSLKKLKLNKFSPGIFAAGLPHFPRNFTRDSIISAMLMGDSKMLKNQLIFCAKIQGKKKDSLTGEEKGKIHHEFPGYKMKNGLYTTYNACDTSALFIIGHYFYLKKTKDNSLFKLQEKNIIRATNYILSHINGGLFFENPSFSGSDKFALKVTYWKDSDIPKRENGFVSYPIVYTLAHIQNMVAIKMAYSLLKKENLFLIYKKMKDSIKKLQDSEGNFYIAVDRKGPVEGVSSDFLHMLFYLSENELNNFQINKIVDNSRFLETPLGYRTLDPRDSKTVKGSYHSKTVWPFEQAIINIGAKKFGLKKIEEVSGRIKDFLDDFPEIFLIKKENNFVKGGCNPQLWTIAAKKYFLDKSSK